MSRVIVEASSEERERLVADFVRLCEVESPSGDERAMADAVTEELGILELATTHQVGGLFHSTC